MIRSTPIFALAMLAACQQPPPEVKTVTNTVTEQNTVTNTVINTVTNTNTVEVPVPSEILEPGHFQSPLVQLAQILDDGGAVGSHGVLEDHMHVDEIRYRASDGKLFECSYYFGVIDASDPADPGFLAQGYEWDFPESPVDRATGCLHLDWDDSDDDIVYVSHRGNYDFQAHLTAVDLGTFAPDPYEPDETELNPNAGDISLSLREPGVSYEGLDAENGYVYVALHAGGLGVFQHDPVTGLMSRVSESEGLIDNAYDVVVKDNLAYLVDEQAGLVILDVTDPFDITLVGELFIGGVDRDLQVDGDYAYIAAGGAGLAIVDVSDPAAPVIVSYTETGGTATRVGYHNNRVAVAAWNDVRVYDVSNRAAPQVIGATRLETEKSYSNDPADERPDITARNLAVDLYNDYLFVGNWWTPYNYQIFDEREAPFAVFPEELALIGLGTVGLQQTGTYTFGVQNAGNAPLTIYDSWVTNGAFTVTPRQVEIPAGGSAELTVNYTASSLSEQSGIVTFLTDDPQQPVRQGYVVGNSPGIGVGDPFPYTEAFDSTTLEAWSSDETMGSVTLVAYFATF